MHMPLLRLTDMLILLILLLPIGGCATNERFLESTFDRQQITQITAPFDRRAAKALMSGQNSLDGSAFVLYGPDDEQLCATVRLIPDTSYAADRIEAVYGNITRKYQHRTQTPYRIFSPDSPEYHTYQRTANCDRLGYFQFGDIGEGSFYLVVTFDEEDKEKRPAATMMQRVRVNAGHTKVRLSHTVKDGKP